MNKTKTIRKNTIYLGVLQIVTMTLPLVAMPLLATRLGINNYGALILSISISQALLLLTDYGFNLSATKETSQNRENIKYLHILWLEVTACKITLSVIGYAVLFAFGLYSSRIQENWVLICATYINVLGAALLPQWLFQGLEKFRSVSLVQVGVKIVCYVFLFAFIDNENDVLFAVLILSSINILSAVLLIPSAMKLIGYDGFKALRVRNIFRRLREGWYLFVSVASSNVYATATTPLIGMIITYSDLTFFHIAERIARGVQSLYAPISGALFPHVSMIAKNDPQNLTKFNFKIICLATPPFIVASLILLFFSENLIGYVFGEDLIKAAPILAILAPLPVLIVFSNTLGIQTLVPLGKERQLSKILLSAALMNIPLLYIFTTFFGVNGAAAVLLGIELFVTVALMIVTLKINNE